MIFIDASAIVAVNAQETGWEILVRRITLAAAPTTSPLAIWEATTALARNKVRPFEEAVELVADFVRLNRIEIIPVTAEIGALAVEASRRFGRGQHKADLNFGDCFAYACARHHRLSLLFKGEDFVHTDIQAA